MDRFTVYPAIDLRKGKVVRLQQGDPGQQTVFGDDPVAVARRWIGDGATWLHVVNLDGALDESSAANWQIVTQLTQLGASVQFGGGVRTLRDVARAIKRGVARIILGTAAIEDPDLVSEAIDHFGAERITVAIDTEAGKVKTHGWQRDTAVTPTDLGLEMATCGVRSVIYTDISRDGVYRGINVGAAAGLAQATGLNVIVSGGVASLNDVRRAHGFADAGVSGVIIGRALYEGKVDLRQAMAEIGD